jgi:hypothetical protein
VIPAADQLGERCLDFFRQPRSMASERATGILGTTIGVAMMIALLGFASNVSLGLWTRSTVDSVAFDAARRVASAPIDESQSLASLHQLEASAIDKARQSLGSYGHRVSMEFEHTNTSVVVLRVRSPAMGLLPRLISSGPILGAVDRRIIIRREGK